MPYGAYARLADGVEGLIRVTDLVANRLRIGPGQYMSATSFGCGSWRSTGSDGGCLCLLVSREHMSGRPGWRSCPYPNV
jgi:hypothetical protein